MISSIFWLKSIFHRKSKKNQLKIKVIAVGVNKARRAELELIATDESMIHETKKFTGLKDFLPSMFKTVCETTGQCFEKYGISCICTLKLELKNHKKNNQINFPANIFGIHISDQSHFSRFRIFYKHSHRWYNSENNGRTNYNNGFTSSKA